MPHLGHAHAVSGQREKALQVLDEVLQQSRQRYIEPYAVAVLYAGLGGYDRAFELLEKAAADRSSFLATWVRGDRRLECLHSDPRFTDLLRRMGLAR